MARALTPPEPTRLDIFEPFTSWQPAADRAVPSSTRGKRTVEQIRAAAVRVFLHQGMQGSTIEAIAEQAQIIEMIEEGLAYDVEARFEAEADRRAIAESVRSMFTGIDLVIAPAASGEAPVGLESTGDPACAAPWTMVGLPSVTVPAGTGEGGMPVGVALIGPAYADRLVLSTAHVLTEPAQSTTNP